MHHFSGRWRLAVSFLALVPLLLGGCTSPRAAFYFQPGPATAANVVPSSSPVTGPPELVASVSVPSAPPFRGNTRQLMAAPGRPAVVARIQAGPAARPSNLAVRRATFPINRKLQPAAPRGHEHDTLHVILGGLLVVGGVLLGLALGGWLGLGVGAVVVLLGYYFLIMGIGGSHAWREIFQEFFNM